MSRRRSTPHATVCRSGSTSPWMITPESHRSGVRSASGEGPGSGAGDSGSCSLPPCLRSSTPPPRSSASEANVLRLLGFLAETPTGPPKRFDMRYDPSMIAILNRGQHTAHRCGALTPKSMEWLVGDEALAKLSWPNTRDRRVASRDRLTGKVSRSPRKREIRNKGIRHTPPGPTPTTWTVEVGATNEGRHDRAGGYRRRGNGCRPDWSRGWKGTLVLQ